MRRLIGVVAVTMALTGCAGAADGDDRPHIVVTTNILGDVVASTVGDAAQVTTLMRPNADPHSFEISAREAAMMRDADLIVSNGLGLEEGLQRHLDRAADAGVETYVAGEQIDVLDYSDGDAEGTPDPHFWTDPARMLDVVDGLEAAVTDIDGIDEQAVEQAAAAYVIELDELDREMTDSFASIPEEHRSLVTNHHVFGYLADRFGFRVVGAVIPGGTTLAAPSAADLRDLTEAIEQAGVRTIFAESSQPDRLIQVLADEAGVDVEVSELFTESLTEKGQGADTYLTMMRANTERITSGLSPGPTD
ncbi:zinc ABC transporter substrate-binding protein AztC [Nocardioides sp. NPDC101246]|uniref:zinc ABC transporter substrate-binding protein AztC n=1 Tax=Nocardioides sp. NPDC101246 TaxID=3364336 RepID=UPI0037FB5200